MNAEPCLIIEHVAQIAELVDARFEK